MIPIVPGDVQASELIARVTATDDDQRMPPRGDPLDDEEVGRLRRWIADGASMPIQAADTPTQSAIKHWSLRPVVRSDVPTVDDASWANNAIDRFVLAKREASGLRDVGDASPEALLRRATYSMTGLPPTPEQTKAFLAQAAVDRSIAWHRVVDRLLTVPEMGERWGRHWMDWVRYADTAGDNSDFPIPQAYLYRNYIVESFNADVPYDRFLTEQIAGDLLPAEDLAQRNRQTIATGYLAMARRFGSLVERYPWHLTIEDTIDNVGRTMMGLTISCARCHDHKFDPISTRDYYGLYGIFASTRYPTPGLELFQVPDDLIPLVSEDRWKSIVKPYEKETRKLRDELHRLLDKSARRAIEDAAAEQDRTVDQQRAARDELDALLMSTRKAGSKLAKHLKKIPAIDSAYAVAEATPTDAAIQIKGEPTRPGAIVPRGFPGVLGGQRLPEDLTAQSSGRLELARWITSSDNPLTARVIANRVWQCHFGMGLVATPNDFGLRGDPPSNPELLDWLADELIRSGWSLKHLHRQILLSHAYQLAALDNPGNRAVDPANRLLWRFNRQRLDAESIRDTLLAISGSLDRTPQTEPYPIPPPRDWEYTQHHPFKEYYPSDKRSLYQMTKRLTVDPYLQSFDGADPNACTARRDQSVTSLQALYFVNNEFLHQQAARLAAHLTELSTKQPRATEDDAAVLIDAFEIILCRSPRDEEMDWLMDYLIQARQQMGDTPDHRTELWASVVRTLLRLNEFIYLD